MPLECPRPLTDYGSITLAHGGGGKMSQRLLDEVVLPALDPRGETSELQALHDGARLNGLRGELAVSTDSFVVRPLFFPGGDIGQLAVHGTTNDLAMCGARPRVLSLSLLLEEGFAVEDLWRVLRSVRAACEEIGVHVVTGDTKVVERGHGDGIYLNTTGLGEVLDGISLRPDRVRAGSRVLVSGPIAEHGMAIMSVREGLQFESDIESDTAALWPVVEELLTRFGPSIQVLRDATRGGVASVLNEIARSAAVGIRLDEASIPVGDTVRAACEILGLDPLYVANEGRFVAFVEADRAESVLEALRAHPLGRGAAIVGETVSDHPGVVRMRSLLGASRVVDMMSGEQLPRIC